MINSFIEIYKDLFYFLRNPKDQQTTNQSVAQKVKVLITLIVLDIPLMGLLTVLVNAFNKLGWVKVENHQMTLLLDLLPIWTVLVLTIIIIPFIEEVIFRLVLRFKRNYLLQAIIYVLPGEENKTKNSILNFWKRKYFYIFYFSAIIFALIHVSNYDSKSTIFYLFPVLILPQFFLALFIGYLRVRYNFMLGYLMHALHNAFFMTIALLTISSSTPKLNTNNSEYSLKIEEVRRA